MSNIAIVTDSSACLPSEMYRAHHIQTVPLTFLFDGAVYDDGSLSAHDFYALLRSSRNFPTTASPAPGAFLDVFREASKVSDAVLCITLPSSFSGTYSSAINATELAHTELPGFPIRVVDSGCLAMCHGFAILSAARAAQAGASLDEAQAVVEKVSRGSYLIGALDTLRYLAKSGRVPMVVHWASSMLRIKPILAAKGEEVKAIARVRTMRRALNHLLSDVERQLDRQGPLHMAVMHADARSAGDDLAATVKRRFQPEELLTTEFTSVMGVHTGPGFLGIAFFSGEPVQSATNLTSGSASQALSSLDADVATLERTLAKLPSPEERPPFVLVCGLPGSGKSHLSRELASRRPLAHLNSDVLRQALFPQPTHGAEESTRLFAAIHAMIQRLLAGGVPVLLDATSLREIHRRPLYELAERTGARLIIVQTEAPADVARARLKARARPGDSRNTSEATFDVYNRMRREADPIERQHLKVDTSLDLEPALEEILRRLENVSERLVT